MNGLKHFHINTRLNTHTHTFEHTHKHTHTFENRAQTGVLCLAWSVVPALRPRGPAACQQRDGMAKSDQCNAEVQYFFSHTSPSREASAPWETEFAWRAEVDELRQVVRRLAAAVMWHHGVPHRTPAVSAAGGRGEVTLAAAQLPPQECLTERIMKVEEIDVPVPQVAEDVPVPYQG